MQRGVARIFAAAEGSGPWSDFDAEAERWGVDECERLGAALWYEWEASH